MFAACYQVRDAQPYTFLESLQGERFEDTKLRLQARLGVSDKDFAKFRFALMQSHHYKQPSPLTDGKFHIISYWLQPRLTYLHTDDVLFEHKFMGQDALGLDHMDKGPRKPNPTERAIVIR